MTFHILELTPYDDVASVRDQLAFLEGDRVLIVWPNGDSANGDLLTRKLDLVLIQREAARSGLRLALVTADPDVRDNAADLHISVFNSIESANRARWRRPRTQIFVYRAPSIPSRAPDRMYARRRRAALSEASRLRSASPAEARRRPLFRGIGIGGLIVAIILIAYGVLPSATVTIYPARGQISTTLSLTADPQVTAVNADSTHIPADLNAAIFEQRQVAIPTTGVRGVPATFATGTVVLSNRTAQPVLVPKGTLVQTLASLQPAQFAIMTDTLIDANGTATVPITATANFGGQTGNVDAGLIAQISGDLANAISVRNPDPTQGGTMREEKFVTDSDREKLLRLARAQILATAASDINLSPTRFIVPNSVQIVEERPAWITYNAFTGDAAETLTLTFKARVQALIVDELTARQVAYARLAGQLGDRTIVLSSLVYQRGTVSVMQPDHTAQFTITASADAISPIDADQVKAQISGATVDQAVAALETRWLLDPTHPPQIAVFPALLNRLPLLPVRISVQIAS